MKLIVLAGYKKVEQNTYAMETFEWLCFEAIGNVMTVLEWPELMQNFLYVSIENERETFAVCCNTHKINDFLNLAPDLGIKYQLISPQ